MWKQRGLKFCDFYSSSISFKTAENSPWKWNFLFVFCHFFGFFRIFSLRFSIIRISTRLEINLRFLNIILCRWIRPWISLNLICPYPDNSWQFVWHNLWSTPQWLDTTYNACSMLIRYKDIRLCGTATQTVKPIDGDTVHVLWTVLLSRYTSMCTYHLLCSM